MARWDPVAALINLVKPRIPSDAQWDGALNAIIEHTLEDHPVTDSTINDFTADHHGLVPKGGTDTAQFLRKDGTWQTPPGAGDVTGPGSSGDGNIPLFDNTTGKLLKDSGVTIETALTDDDTKIPTGGAVSDVISAVKQRILYTGISGTTQAAAVNAGYIPLNTALTTITLPATAAVGDVVAITGYNVGGWKLAQNASQLIRFLTLVTTTGTGGYILATSRYDCVTVRCVVANTTWIVENAVGNLEMI